MNQYKTSDFIRVRKDVAEKLFYNGLGTILTPTNMYVNNPQFGNFPEHKVNEEITDFDNLVNQFEYYNGKAWFWVYNSSYAIYQCRVNDYKQLKTINQTYKHFGVDLDKNPNYFDENGMPDLISVTNVVYDYIIKYKLTNVKIQPYKDLEYILNVLELFGMEGYKYDDYTRLLLVKVMKYIGFIFN